MDTTTKRAMILDMACEYANVPRRMAHTVGGTKKEVPTGEMVNFFMVGHNSTHEFHVGLAEDGTIWRYSVGEGMYPPDQTDYSEPPPLERHFSKVDPESPYGWGYLGHL